MFEQPAVYVVQNHRFDVYEDVGCFTNLSIVPFTFPIIYGIPFLIGLVSVIYGVLTVRTLRKHRRQLEDPELCVSDFKLVNFMRDVDGRIVAGDFDGYSFLPPSFFDFVLKDGSSNFALSITRCSVTRPYHLNVS